MHRLLAIFLMLVVPVQFGWSTALSIHGHSHGDVAALGFHTHDSHPTGHSDHHHPHPGEAPSDQTDSGIEKLTQNPGGAGSAGQSDGERLDGHYHPILASLVMDIALPLPSTCSGGPPSRPPDALTSRTPPLFDWPPSARA
jgi:hypothetical protein